ncbi:MAG TPA: fused MFS/spermidine synthase, partial [Candidatus Eisenbacteria bacterium]|nr:fused MFS/spermidine synthase [Candidatus Eisenbacteria bacterium]
GSLLVALSPNLFSAVTRGLSYVGEGRDFGAYQLQAFGLALKVLFVPTVLLGVVFPYLLKESEGHARNVGGTVGTLLAVNTLGAIVGSLVAGFVLLETVGLWGGIRCLAALGFLGVVIAAPPANRRVLIPVSVALAVICLVPFAQPPRLKVDPAREKVLQVWEGSSGITAVIEDDGGRRTKVNNHYTLGGSGAAETERRQGLLPLLLHPHPEAVFYLGLGTGITAGGAMGDPVPRQVTVCEVVPDAVAASRAYFGDYTRGLFEDPRTRILVEDGRTVLRGTSERYDVVVADLFVPWQAGEGTLYSQELYQTIRQRLGEDGLFAQWLPLYQMSRREFEIVARTMLSVFPQVTLWRADFSGGKATLALVGSAKPGSIYPEILRERLLEVEDAQPLVALGDSARASVPAFLLGYCGNLTEGRELIGDGPVATDDQPLIEYLAPITHRRVGVKKATWFAGQELMDFLETLQERIPPQQDPVLGNFTAKEQGYVRAGLLVHQGRVFREAGKTEEADRIRRELVDLLASLSRM